MIIIGGFIVSILNGLIGLFIFLFKDDEDHNWLIVTVALIACLLFTFGISVSPATWPYISLMMP